MDKFAQAVTGTKKPKVADAPAPVEAPSTPMPDQDALQQAAMREELRRKKTGRASTNLVNEDEDSL
jgi:hypothetical protein